MAIIAAKKLSMAEIRMPKSFRSNPIALSAALCTAGSVAPASAQSEGGLYAAGYGLTFQEVAVQTIAQKPGGRRFFCIMPTM